MANERVQKSLAVILAAAVAGYLQLMGADEEGTLAALTAHRVELADRAMHRARCGKTCRCGPKACREMREQGSVRSSYPGATALGALHEFFGRTAQRI